MRKISYILLSLALLAGCNKPDPHQHEVLEGCYIFFDGGTVKTKATENLVETETLPVGNKTSFGVFGFRADGVTPVFSSYNAGVNSPLNNTAIVYRPGRSEDFRYDNLELWHEGQHSFYAYYITGVNYEYDDLEDNDYTQTTDIFPEIGVREVTQGTQTVKKAYARYNQPTDVRDMADILTAATITAPSASPVSFNFGHMLFAMDVVIRNSAGGQMKVTSAKVEFKVKDSYYMYFDGTAEVVPTAQDCSVTYEFINTETIIAGAPSATVSTNFNLNEVYIKAERGNNYYTFLFPPCDALDVTFEMTFLNSWDEEATFVYGDDDTEMPITVEGGFRPGVNYQFVITRKEGNGADVLFVPSIEVWVPNDDINHTLN